jgi:hypothetical protein
MLHHHFNLKNDKAARRFVQMCSVAALFAIASLPGSASASPISAGTRAAVPLEAVLLQEVQCQQVYRLQGRRYVRRVICDRPGLRDPLPPGQAASLLFLPQFLPRAELGPVGAPRF